MTAGTLAAHEARAFPSSRLVYERAPGAEECPDPEVVRRAVAERLGYDPFFPTADKSIVARITRDGTTLRALVELVDDQGHQLGVRELTGNAGACSELLGALALSISIAIDPKSAETYRQGPADTPPDSANAAANPSATDTAATALAPERSAPMPSDAAIPRELALETRRARTLDWSIAVGGLAAFSHAPATSFGAFAAGEVRQGPLSLALEAELELPKTVQLDAAHDARVYSYQIAALPCWHPNPFALCLSQAVGTFHARGNEAGAGSGATLLLELGARARVELPLTGALGLLANADAIVNLQRPRIGYGGHGLWRAPPGYGRIGLGLALHFR